MRSIAVHVECCTYAAVPQRVWDTPTLVSLPTHTDQAGCPGGGAEHALSCDRSFSLRGSNARYQELFDRIVRIFSVLLPGVPCTRNSERFFVELDAIHGKAKRPRIGAFEVYVEVATPPPRIRPCHPPNPPSACRRALHAGFNTNRPCPR